MPTLNPPHSLTTAYGLAEIIEAGASWDRKVNLRIKHRLIFGMLMLCVYMCIRVYIYIYIYVRVCVYIYIYTCV